MTQPHDNVLRPPATKGHHSVAKLYDYWYVACPSKKLGPASRMSVTINGLPLVLFRTKTGEIGALLDRCPHRNVPLSLGKVTRESLQCKYHGWEFAPDGACTKIPGLLGPADGKARNATSYPIREQDGFIWVFTSEGKEPSYEPFRVPHVYDGRYTHVRRTVDARSTVHAAIENALDVPHTSFLHAGLFRGIGERNKITAIVRRDADRVEAEYVGEPRPQGLAARILSPRGGEVSHFDRFILPSIAQVDYRLGEDTHISVTSFCTPITDFHTRLFAVISFRLARVPGALIKPILDVVGRRIFAQDAEILKAQTDAIQSFGGENYVSTDIDILGPHIWKLLKAAERNKLRDSDSYEKRIELSV